MQTATRTIAIIAGVAVLSMGAGLGLGRMIVSPAEAAAQGAPPEARAITVPVERRTLANDVVMRGDVLYEDPASIAIEAGDLGGPAVVTGQVPEVGATVEAGQVVLEVTGRPVVLLTGELPVYRTLRAGVSGPDVAQLKQALAQLEIDAGDGDVYDARTASGVAALYERLGYAPPSAGEEALGAVSLAEEALQAAESQLVAAHAEVAATGEPPTSSERIRLEGAIESARLRYEQTVASCEAPSDEMPCDRASVVDAKTEYEVAIATRDEAFVPRDTSAPRAAVAAATQARDAARNDLAEARGATLTPLPASEVVYLASTPRRVDSVEVQRGSTVAGGPVMTVSGATLQITGSVGDADAELLTPDLPTVVMLPDGSEVPGRVVSVGAPPRSGTGGGEGGTDGPAAGRKAVVVEPGEMTEEQRSMLQGSNVRVEIPVGATAGDVLTVPIAALTAGPGGEARVEVMGADGETTLVNVRTGLAAGGFVEVTALGSGSLDVGDRVVVGQSGSPVDTGSGTEGVQDVEEGEESGEDAAEDDG